MGFCSQCGEIMPRDPSLPCRACGHAVAYNPVTQGDEALEPLPELSGQLGKLQLNGRAKEPEPSPPAEACAACGKALTGGIICALDKKWHEGCFVCAHCAKPFAGAKFIDKDGLPYHSACHTELFASRCTSCSEPLQGKYVTVEGLKYHKACFVCKACGCTLEQGFAFGPDGTAPYCAEHIQDALAQKSDGACGESDDGFTLDPLTLEKVFTEARTQRRYRLDASGTKKYEDERKKPVYGGAKTWRQDGS